MAPSSRLPWRFASAVLLVALLLGLPGLAGTSFAQQPNDFEVPGGRFYTQGAPSTTPGYGYAVLDTPGIPLFHAFQELGGVARLGYPISHRFLLDGFPAQAFEGGVIYWRTDANVGQIVNVFDWMGQNGFDDYLIATYGAAPSLDWRDDVRFPWETVKQRHWALLDASPAIKHVYLSSGADPVTYYGLPQSVVDHGPSVVVRAQRAIFQEWKVETPWAKPGTVFIISDGEAFKAAGILPDNATAPLLPPAAISLAGFPPVPLRSLPARGGSLRAPAPPPDAPCPPYAPVQGTPSCNTPFFAGPPPVGPYHIPAGPVKPAAPVAPAPVQIAPAPVAPLAPAPIVPAPIGPGPIVPAPIGPAPIGPAPIAPPAPYPVLPPGFGAPGLGPLGFGGSCLGDESIEFVPKAGLSGTEFNVEVSSNRYTLGVGLAGPGSVRLKEVVAGGKGTVWKFGVTVGRGNWTYVFTRDGGAFGCVQASVAVVDP